MGRRLRRSRRPARQVPRECEARLDSRGRASEALERGKVFVNDAEVSLDEAEPSARGRRSHPRLDGSAWQRSSPNRPASCGAAICTSSMRTTRWWSSTSRRASSPCRFPFAATSRRSRTRSWSTSGRMASGGRSSFIESTATRPVWSIFAKRADAQAAVEGAVQAARARARVSGRGLRPSVPAAGSWRDHLAWDQRVADSKGNTSGRSSRPKRREATTACSKRSKALRWWRCGWSPASETRSALQARLRGHTLVGEQRYTFRASQTCGR